jgi:hypothetical protein
MLRPSFALRFYQSVANFILQTETEYEINKHSKLQDSTGNMYLY